MADDNTSSVIDIVHILQTDKPTDKWILSFKNKFHKALKFDAMHQ